MSVIEKTHQEGEALCGGNVPLCQRFRQLRDEDDHVADEICAIRTLTEVVEHFKGNTMMEMFSLLETQVDILKNSFPECPGVASGTELFLKFALRLKGDASSEDLSEVQSKLVERGHKFISRLERSRETIGELAIPFFRDGCTVLVHGYSRVVLAVLRIAKEHGRIFNVICTESRPDSMGFRMASDIIKTVGIPCSVIMDSAAAAIMDRIDFILCGSQIICESGGIINKIGTYQLSLVAKEFGKPFYVAAESFKFQRLYPLCQADVKQSSGKFDFSESVPGFLFTSNSRSPNSKPFSLLRSSPDIPVTPAVLHSDGSSSSLLMDKKSDDATSDSVPKETSSGDVIRSIPDNVRLTWSTLLGGDVNTLPLIDVLNPLSSDYTDPSHITLLFTDFGVLTPSVVSDELIRIFNT